MSSVYPWQQSQWQRLQAARQQGRLPHALLLTGAQGMGKAAFARLFAQSLLCATTLQDAIPCGVCRYCRLYEAGNHPDISSMAPPEGKKVIAVDQIRAIAQFVTLTSQYAGYKVVIIEPAEAMNINASNSLLKTLEEPSAETLLLLVTHQPAQLPATIRSRCQEIRFGIEPDAGRAWLAQQLPTDVDIDLLLALAGGAPLKALELSGEGMAQQRERLLDGLEQLVRRQLDPIALAAQCVKLGAERSLDWLYSWSADMIRLKSAAGRPPRQANPDLHDRLLKLADQVSLTQLFLLQDRVRQAQRALERNLNPSLVMESVLIHWQHSVAHNKQKIA